MVQCGPEPNTHMKHIARLVLLAAALLGVKPLHAQSEDGPIRLRVDVDRTVLPADCTGRAVVNIRLDCPRPPESERRPPRPPPPRLHPPRPPGGRENAQGGGGAPWRFPRKGEHTH